MPANGLPAKFNSNNGFDTDRSNSASINMNDSFLHARSSIVVDSAKKESERELLEVPQDKNGDDKKGSSRGNSVADANSSPGKGSETRNLVADHEVNQASQRKQKNQLYNSERISKSKVN